MTDIDNIPSQSNYSFLKDKEEDKEIEIDYNSLINLSEKDFSVDLVEEKDEVVFYCRTCKKFVDVARIPSRSKKQKKVQFSCNECNKKTVFYGTKRGIDAHFHLNG